MSRKGSVLGIILWLIFLYLCLVLILLGLTSGAIPVNLAGALALGGGFYYAYRRRDSSGAFGNLQRALITAPLIIGVLAIYQFWLVKCAHP